MAKAGTAYVEVVGDFSKLKRQLAQQMAGTKQLHLAIDFDQRGVRQAERTLKQVGDRVRKKPITQEINVDYNNAGVAAFHRDVEDTNRSLGRNRAAAVGASGGIGALGKAMKGTHIPFVSFNTRIPVARLALFGKLAYDAAGGVISLTSALAPMTGVLASVGSLATSAAQGIASIKLATAGIGDAISAAFAEQDKAATGSAASLKAQETAAEGVREAQLSLSAAQRTARQAQEDLTQSRQDATREIEDMRRAVRDLALQEEGASLSLREAKEAFAELSKTGAGDLEIEQAALRIKEARSELRKTREEAHRARQDLGGVDAAGGVKGMPQVVAARRGLADANRGVVEAEREVANSMKASAEAMQASGGSADALAAKMAALSPPARQFAKFIIGLRPQLKRLQAIAGQGLLPGVEKGITSAMHNLPRLQKIIGRTSKALGDLAAQAGKRLGSEEWGKDLETQGARNEVTIRRLGGAVGNLVEAFKDVTLAAGPMVDRLTKWIVALTGGWKESANAARESGRLQRFFKDAGDTFFKVTRILGNLFVSLKNIGRASREAFGNDLLNAIAKGARNLREWTGSLEGQRELRQVFKDIGDNIKAAGRFIRDISDDFRQMKKEGMTTGEALSHIFLDVFTEAIANGAEFGAKMAVAFVKGFLKADIWGKLIAGGFIAARLAPIISLFRKQGVVAGAAMGTGMAEGATAGMVGTGAAAAGGGLFARLGAKLLPLAKRAGIVGLGVALADTTLNEFSRQAALRGPDALAALRSKASGLSVLGKDFAGEDSLIGKLGLSDKFLNKGQEAARRIEPILRGIASAGKSINPIQAQKLREEIAKLPDISEKARKGLRSIVNVGLERGNRLERDVNRIRTAFVRLTGGATTSLKDLRRTSEGAFAAIGRTMGLHTGKGRKAAEKNFGATQSAIQQMVHKGEISSRKGMREIARLLTTYSQQGKTGVFKNFKELAPFLGRTMTKSGDITQRGVDTIRTIMQNSLLNLGLSKNDIRMSINKKESARKGKTQPGQRGGLVGDIASGARNYQTGGLVQFGQRGGKGPDNIPVQFGQEKIVVGSGEVGAVFNRHQLPVLNARLSDMGGLPGFFNKFDRKHSATGGIVSGLKKFAKGGLVGMMAAARKLEKAHFPYLWGGGHSATPAPFGPMDCSGAVSFVLQHGGVEIPTMVSGALASAGKPGPGTVTVFANPTHTFMRIGSHYFGTSGSNPGGGAGFFPDPGQGYKAGFAQRHFVGGEVFGADQIPRIVVEGTPGLAKTTVQAALDATRRGANTRLDDIAGSTIGSGDPGDPGPGNTANQKLGRAMAAKFGWTGNEWNALRELWNRESGWDANAVNPSSGAAGIPQALGHGHVFDLGDARAQIAWGLNYIKSRYGAPSSALSFHDSHNWYEKGGGVGFGGGARKKEPKGLPKLKGLSTGRATRKTAKVLANAKDKKRRAKILARFSKKLKGLVPQKLLNEIEFYGRAHDQFSEFAQSALGGDVTDDNGDVTKQGLIQGKNYGDWLVKDLDAMFKMRNKLVKAKNIVTSNKGQVDRTFKWVSELLKGYSKGGDTPKGWKGINPARDSVEKWNKQSQPKRIQQMKKWRDKHGKLPGTREFDTHTGKIQQVPKSKVESYKTLKTKLGNQQTKMAGLVSTDEAATDSLPTQLQTLQGFGPPGILKSPWPRGTIFGGDILSTQDDILALFKVPPATTDDTSDSGESTELLQQLLREANLRTAISERQFDVLRNFPPFGGQFETGGVIPGPAGAPRTVIAHGGETITPAGAAAPAPHVYVQFDGKATWLRDFVRTEVKESTRKMSSGRVLPGRGGGN